MLIFYIDEFGDKSLLTQPDDVTVLKSGVSPYFVLSAVGIQDSSRKALAEALFALKEKHLGEAVAEQPWGESEIKGRHLTRAARSVANGKVLQSPRAFAKLSSPKQVDAFVRDIGLLFSQFHPVIFSVVVDKKELLRLGKTEDPVGLAYAYLNQRVALAMDRLYSGESAMLVADQQTEHEKYFRSGRMNALRDSMTAKLTHQPNYKLVLDKPLWVDTDLSSWDREIIQLADIVAYSTGEAMLRGQAPHEASYLWKQIHACLAVHWSSGDVQRAGFALHPPTSTYPKMRQKSRHK